MHAHNVVTSKCLATIRAFARAVGEAVLDAFLAEDVAARLDDRILEGGLANLALEHSLLSC